MAEKLNQPIQICHDIGCAPGEWRALRFSRNERLWRGLKQLLITWGIGVATILIPIIHFVLPLVLLVLGMVLAVRRYTEVDLPQEAVGRCPVCAADITLHLDSGARLPRRTYCPACDKPIGLSVA